MHDIEPYWNWRDDYIAAEDERSPFFGRTYSEFEYTNKVYNYLLHPQWDEVGNANLYLKLLWADYDAGTAVMEFIGEWNDAVENDIMFLKRDIIDPMMKEGIFRYVLICENVLNFHSGDEDYYEEWYEDLRDEDGWIVLLNTLQHVEEEMKSAKLQYFLNFGIPFNEVNWRQRKPQMLCELMDQVVNGRIKSLPF